MVYNKQLQKILRKITCFVKALLFLNPKKEQKDTDLEFYYKDL